MGEEGAGWGWEIKGDNRRAAKGGEGADWGDIDLQWCGPGSVCALLTVPFAVRVARATRAP